MRLRYRQLLPKCRFAPLGKSFRYLKTPSRHISKHTITTTFLLKNGTLKKACHCASFSDNGHNRLFRKNRITKKPLIARRKTITKQELPAFKKLYACLKSPVLARLSDGSGTAQFALKHRGELLSPQARKTNFRDLFSHGEENSVPILRYDKRVIGYISTYTLAL